MIKKIDSTEPYANIYYSPELFNAKQIEEVEDEGLFYEFHKVVLWEDLENGTRWFAMDCGCSCPSPFEWVESQYDLTPYIGHEQEYKDLCAEAKGRTY